MDLRYPIGRYEVQPYSERLKEERLGDIKFLPLILENAVATLDAAQLETPYRDGGWTIRQVVHHVCDSHMNALCRLKLALTEDNPVIKPYDEGKWAETTEYKNLPVNISLTMLHTIHAKLYDLFFHLGGDQWKRTYFHPEHQQSFDLWYLLGMYSWHGKHHTAHITSLKERKGW
jgi:hypothetical protein